MMAQMFSAAAVATLPTSDQKMEAGLSGSYASPASHDSWAVVANVSPHAFQLLDEEGSVLGIIWPWATTVIPLQPANERRIVSLHPLIKLSASAVVPQGVWAEITTVEPVPMAGGGTA